MAKYNVENEHVEIDIERLLKFTPEVVYEAWTKEELLKQWFMTTQRTNQSLKRIFKRRTVSNCRP